MDFLDLPPNLAKKLIESNFRATIIRTVPGTSGLVYIMENEPGTVPQFFAVKTINHEQVRWISETGIDRFVRELKQWYAYGDHRLILRPFYVKVIDNWPFIAMPFCEENLRVLVQTPMHDDLAERLSIAVQLCHSLVWAQGRGLVAHQDLKPENILLQDPRVTWSLPLSYPLRWFVRVSDFGLANAYSEIGIRYGSRPYMAPEQYAGGPDFSKVDVFAVGVILTELFSGFHPIGERTTDVWPNPLPEKGRKWTHEKLWKAWATGDEKLNSRIEATPVSLKGLLVRMLQSDPQSRPGIGEAEDELKRVLSAMNAGASSNLEAALQHFDQDARKSIAADEASSEKFPETQLRKLDDDNRGQ